MQFFVDLFAVNVMDDLVHVDLFAVNVTDDLLLVDPISVNVTDDLVFVDLISVNMTVDLVLVYLISVNVTDDEEHYPVHFCCKSGHLNVLSYLLEKKALPHVCNIYGDTPLHLWVTSQ